MKIIIVGCGKIGTTILESFVKEGFDVVALDNDPTIVEQVTNVYDAIGVCGNGADCETLMEAGVDEAELVVAATNSDELNMLSCFLAHKLGAKHTIARIRNPEYNDKSLSFMNQHLDLTMSINPELLAAQEMFKILRIPSAVTVETFAQDRFEMIELVLRPDSKVVGHSLMELRKQFTSKFLVCVAQRGDKVYIPDGNFVLEGGDRIGIMAATSEMSKLLKQAGLLKKHAKNVIILGASHTSYYLAKKLIETGTAVKIIDMDRARCEEFATLLPEAVIIEGDGIQQELLIEEGIMNTDAFVALTGKDEGNILISIFASSQNVPKVITKVNKTELAIMADKLGLECIISPKKIISDVLTRYARALKNSLGSTVETLYKIMDDKAEALEFKVQEDFKGLNTPLMKLAIKPHILIAGIIRGRKVILPTGSDVIMPGDNVIVLAAGKQLNDLSDILE